MLRGQRQSQAPQPANVNLFCKQCNSQIGIFENEWIRLTSSYARSKEKGTHFGSEIGQRVQNVPAGAAAAHATGCQMAEIFCRKCSNMVGQYCKGHVDAQPHPLINQYFYKLSRTYLKDSSTQREIDPVFAFDSDVAEPSRELSTTRPRQNNTPSRWQGTPLRQSSSTPATVQTAALKRRRDIETQDSPNIDEIDQTGDIQAYGGSDIESERDGINSKSRYALSQIQMGRNFDLEDQLHKIQGRLLRHERRSTDQENFLNDQAARIHEQDAVIEEQRSKIEEQDYQISQINNQLQTLHRSMKELQTSLWRGSSTPFPQLPQVLPADSSEHFEMMARSMNHAQSVAREVAILRTENERLRARLSMSGISTSLQTTGRDPDGLESPFLHTESMLGKRKRGETGAEQIPTPHSDSSEDPSAIPPIPTMVPTPLEIGSYNQKLSTEQTASNDLSLERSSQNTAHNRKCKTGRNSGGLPDQQTVAQPVLVRVGEASDIITPGQPTIDSNDTAHIEIPPLINVNFSDDDIVQDNATTNVIESIADSASSICYGVRMAEQNLTFVQDPTAFEDEDFSDDDDNDDNTQIFTFGDEDPTLDSQRENEEDSYPTYARDNRSTAPEPRLKPRKVANRTKTHISLDRVHIATPWMFWEAIHNGQQPKLWKPPAIQTRKKELAEELYSLGLHEWIYKDKKSKEYRQAVSAARARLREAKKAALMSSKGLTQPSISSTAPAEPSSLETSVLNTIQNVRAANSGPQQDVEMASGDENPRPAAALHDKNSESQNIDEVDIAPAMLTRGRARRAETAQDNEPTTSNSLKQSKKSKPTQSRAKRRKTDGPGSINHNPDPQDSNQDDTGEHETTAEIAKQANSQKSRRGPRKSAPAALSTDMTEVDGGRTVGAGQSNIDPLLLPLPGPVSDDGAAGALNSQPGSAAKERLLEKMRLKARQQEQEQEDAIMARDKLAEEAMAAMELDGMMA